MAKRELSDEVLGMILGMNPDIVAGMSGVFGRPVDEIKPLDNAVNPQHAMEQNQRPGFGAVKIPGSE